ECWQCHEKAWRAESALHRAGFNKSALKPVQVNVLTAKSFDRVDTAAIHRQSCDDARIGGVPVDHDGASATFALVAPALGSRQKEAVPQYAQEGRLRADIDHVRGSVDCDAELHALFSSWQPPAPGTHQPHAREEESGGATGRPRLRANRQSGRPIRAEARLPRGRLRHRALNQRAEPHPHATETAADRPRTPP